MESVSTRRIVRTGIVAAIYVVLTLALSFMSYGSVQFRIAEMLMLLCLYSKDYVVATTIGCFIANLFSFVGPVDVAVGTGATLFSGLCIYLLRDRLRPLSASIFPVLFNAVFVGLELKFIANAPLLLSMAGVAAGEIVCVSMAGVILLTILKRNKGFMKMLLDEGGQFK
ncbi:Uncharacterized membrane protein [Ruminococcus sp. YE71]|uniref:QueT transporter family protein n=1 Tax=unclassified Ruminococcus TaxID=2608920 RepID=UPI00087EA2F6|nr:MULTISPECIES: QueT transporter family protein [unclassified Ruminococcus]SDA18444.1 Uncharacterized membrane protein [Ruminococcus sp. YE78]SFW29929.1 Uncharacterized membrane protein [Ruminococcus sp. YE71]